MAESSIGPFDYLEGLSETAFKRLYQQPSTALAIFRRFLPHLAKTFVMAMLFLNDPLPVAHLDSWVRPGSERERETAVDILARLKILSIVQAAGQPESYRLTNPFCSSLRQALTGSGNHRSFGVPGGIAEEEQVSLQFLAEYGTSQWEGILYYVVGSTGTHTAAQLNLSDGTRTLLSEAEFVESIGRTVNITAKGFTFLLQDINAQVWSLLIEYLEYASDALGMDNIDVLSFLFTIGSLEIGENYGVKTLTQTQRRILDDLHDFGIIYKPSLESNHFYPTPLASTVTSDESNLGSALSANSSIGMDSNLSSSQKGFIVIETNFRIYAYTSSNLQIQILNLFTKLITRFPNMVSGRITKESIQSAIGRGITSQQIISYLTSHAHPIMGSQGRQQASTAFGQQSQPRLPPDVVDQIRLWQIEGDRMKTTSGYLFRDFKDRKEYEEIMNYARTVGVLEWRNDQKGLFFATHVEQLQRYLANRQRRMKEAETNGTKS